MAKPHDVSWPPLDVKDLKPESSAIKEIVKFGTLREALLKAHGDSNKHKHCHLCDISGHIPGKECPCCCSNCGGQKDGEGNCPKYCIDDESTEYIHTLYCPRGCCDHEIH